MESVDIVNELAEIKKKILKGERIIPPIIDLHPGAREDSFNCPTPFWGNIIIIYIHYSKKPSQCRLFDGIPAVDNRYYPQVYKAFPIP